MEPQETPSSMPEPSAHSRRYIGRKSVHHPKPDYTRPAFRFKAEEKERLHLRLAFLYGTEEAERWWSEVERVCAVFVAHKPPERFMLDAALDPLERFTEEDVILITYGDLIQGRDRSPLTTLSKFCGLQLRGCINTLHILPFFPSSSDRGFAVVDFDQVDPILGTWEDLQDLETRYQLMFDGVINHVSSQSRWFLEFLNGHPHYRKFFTSFRAPGELLPEQRSLIFRPRTSDVLTPFATIDGPRYVWTTFSGDQIDLDYRNPEVLIRVLEVLLHYVRRGADLIRLDAVTYLWRRPGTACVHLPETHETVKIFREVLGWVAPHVALITETNVPHADNIAYFGNGNDEAHMVYNFALPPLLLHTFYTEDATRISAWLRDLEPPSETTHFLNFLDSHDGMGLLAARGILSGEEMQALVARTRLHGGLISYRTEPDGEEAPYEINITWFSALNQEHSGEPLPAQVERFLASRAVAMALRGVPGMYLHSLFGTHNDREAVLRTGVKRDINRCSVDYDILLAAMADPTTSIAMILEGLTHLLRVRTKERAFHPRGPQQVLELGPPFIGLVRQSPERDRTLLAITNITGREAEAVVPLEEGTASGPGWRDLLSARSWMASEGRLGLRLRPYETVWLTPQGRDDRPDL